MAAVTAMHYDVALRIRYDYAGSAERARTLLRLSVPDLAGAQAVLSQRLIITPAPDERIAGRDFFENGTVLAVWHRPVGALDLALSLRLRREAAALPPDPGVTLADLPGRLAALRDLGPLSPLHHLHPSPRIPPAAAIATFARTATAGAPTVRQAIQRTARALNRAMIFDSRATRVDTPPEAAFAQRRGVCQDYAQILIGGLRSLGIPAGYVSGFLRTEPPPGQKRLEGVDAMHAWVRAWDGAGWIDIDPTNDRLAGIDYITVARGRDYGDAAPVLGALSTAGGQGTRQAVDVVALD